jgi:hypothetical protein
VRPTQQLLVFISVVSASAFMAAVITIVGPIAATADLEAELS